MSPLRRPFRRDRTKLPGPRGRAPQAVYVGGNRVLTTTVNGDRLFVDARDLSLSPDFILSGCGGRGVRRASSSLVREGMTVVEVGANIGSFTAVLGRLVGRRGCVRAFEANPTGFDMLNVNIDI